MKMMEFRVKNSLSRKVVLPLGGLGALIGFTISWATPLTEGIASYSVMEVGMAFFILVGGGAVVGSLFGFLLVAALGVAVEHIEVKR